MPVVFDNDRFTLAQPEFYWPKTGEQEFYSNPIERTGGLLVRELARVGWEVPGLEIQIGVGGCGENIVRAVRSIKGRTESGPFELAFQSAQERRGRWGICPGLSKATIPPGIQLEYSRDDRHSPVAYLYTGNDWKTDGASFINEWKTDTNEDKQYRKYSGNGRPGLMRYQPAGLRYSDTSEAQPRALDSELLTAKVLEFIELNLLSTLAAMPTAAGSDDITPQGDANLRRLAAVQSIPAPEDFPVLFTWVARNDAYRLRDLAESEPDERFGVSPIQRLCFRSNVPEVARRQYSYASSDPTARIGHVIHHPNDEASPVAVKLKHLNDVWVVDNAAFRHAAEAAIKKAESEGRKRLTDAELNECEAATARTIVPAADYNGGFETPVYLIGRQTEIDEVRLIRGNIEVAQADDRTSVTLMDEVTGSAFLLFDRGAVGPGTISSARRTASDYAGLHSGGRFRDRIPEPAADSGHAFRM
ncbi:hypothetical protein ACVIGB_000485 [Bradyrhizobium sp. USDA 4341]